MSLEQPPSHPEDLMLAAKFGIAASGSRLDRLSPMQPAVLHLSNVCKHFGGIRAVDGISFEVLRGARVGLIGPNGSGKTTLLNAIAGQDPPDSGEIIFDGQSLARRSPAATARIGVLRTFQDAGVFEGMNVLQNMHASRSRSVEGFSGLWRRADSASTGRALDLLNFVGLGGRTAQQVRELSYGQRKLLEFAMALMNEPKMLLLDEPAAGVSPALIPQLISSLRRANSELGITLLFVEHNMRVVNELAQQVICLARGRLLAAGTPEAIRSNPAVIEAYLGPA